MTSTKFSYNEGPSINRLSSTYASSPAPVFSRLASLYYKLKTIGPSVDEIPGTFPEQVYNNRDNQESKML